jgi:dolichyl-phosphate beta-glucosyltransferase
MTELSIVIPAYNEEARLGPTLRRVVDYLAARHLPGEVLVVDDGSSDRTADVASGFAAEGVRLLRHDRNRGKGAAVRTGVEASGGRRVLISDADLSTPVEELEKLELHLATADLVLGSRALQRGARLAQRQPLYRELMGKTFNLIIRLLGVRGIYDTQCGFKLLRGDVARELFAGMTLEGFAYDVELVLAARRAGYRVAEVGVVWSNSPASTVDPVRSSFEMLRDVVKLRLSGARRGSGRAAPQPEPRPGAGRSD